MDSMQDWGKQFRRQFITQIGKAKLDLAMYMASHDSDLDRKVLEQRNILNELLVKEETYWRQRSKNFWLRGYDRNNKFFHNMASYRKRINKIVKLQWEDGSWAENQNDLKDVIKGYFTNLFSAGDLEEMPNMKYLHGIWW